MSAEHPNGKPRPSGRGAVTKAELARKIRDAIFDRAEADGRVMHGDVMDRLIEDILVKADLARELRPSSGELVWWPLPGVAVEPHISGG